LLLVWSSRFLSWVRQLGWGFWFSAPISAAKTSYRSFKKLRLLDRIHHARVGEISACSWPSVWGRFWTGGPSKKRVARSLAIIRIGNKVNSAIDPCRRRQPAGSSLGIPSLGASGGWRGRGWGVHCLCRRGDESSSKCHRDTRNAKSLPERVKSVM
jgi:hypothetical protein